MSNQRVAGYSVDWIDAVYVIMLLSTMAIMWNAAQLAHLVHESTGADTSSAHWMILLLWAVLSAIAAVGLVTRKRTFRKR